ncbi:hypothetical protein [Nafulsella turpanensis]|uniref:hypothetical protein n=1 Tax=Nafulsella turpanensis TaxID=1265690 RepID=UPI00035E8E91|nr:hypothetical protein [Nafulsella turpanensis]
MVEEVQIATTGKNRKWWASGFFFMLPNLNYFLFKRDREQQRESLLQILKMPATKSYPFYLLRIVLISA